MPALLLKNADVYAPVPLGKCDILVVNDKIAAVQPHIAPPAWSGHAGDGRHRLAVPGLMDAHVHIIGGLPCAFTHPDRFHPVRHSLY